MKQFVKRILEHFESVAGKVSSSRIFKITARW